MTRFFIVLVALFCELLAQDTIRNHVSFEVGGAGIVYSVNYERSIAKHVTFRIGVSYFELFSKTEVIPMCLNYLVGNAPHLYEFGGGLIYVKSNKSVKYVFSPSIYYRYQQINEPGSEPGIFIFRIGFNYFMSKNNSLPVPGLSLGFGF